MIAAGYLDTSALLAVLFRQPEAERVFNAIRSVPQVVSSDLIISETLSACRRERVDLAKARVWLERIHIIRAVVDEDATAAVLKHGYIRGADLHHVTSALWMFEGLERQVCFATLDDTQAGIAAAFGFLPLPA